MTSPECQSMQIHHIPHEKARLPPLSIFRRFKLEVRRHLSPDRYRWLKQQINRLLLQVSRSEAGISHKAPSADAELPSLQAGEKVRIKSAVEIESMLNRWKEFKGCGFMDDMWEFCSSEQRVLKPVRRFVDERDYKVKSVKGIVLLEGLTCKGTPILGRCDRNCYYFWREEWLERIGQDRAAHNHEEKTL